MCWCKNDCLALQHCTLTAQFTVKPVLISILIPKMSRAFSVDLNLVPALRFEFFVLLCPKKVTIPDLQVQRRCERAQQTGSCPLKVPKVYRVQWVPPVMVFRGSMISVCIEGILENEWWSPATMTCRLYPQITVLYRDRPNYPDLVTEGDSGMALPF